MERRDAALRPDTTASTCATSFTDDRSACSLRPTLRQGSASTTDHFRPRTHARRGPFLGGDAQPANFSADDPRVEHTDLFQPGPLIRHTFSDVLWWPAGKSASPAKADRGRS